SVSPWLWSSTSGRSIAPSPPSRGGYSWHHNLPNFLQGNRSKTWRDGESISLTIIAASIAGGRNDRLQAINPGAAALIDEVEHIQIHGVGRGKGQGLGQQCPS